MANGVPLEVKDITYLDFARGEPLLALYKESIAKLGDKARQTLDRFSLGNGNYMLGSSSFMAVQLGGLVRIATPAELERAVGSHSDFFRNKYEDVALVLRSEGDSYAKNDFVARNLAEQVEARLGEMPTPEKPARVSLKGMTLKEDSNSAYGLVFNIGDAEVISASEFSNANHGKRFLKTDDKGLPIFDEQGNRTFYARDNGLSRLYLDWNLGLRSDSGNLGSSGSGGRVPVVVTSEAGSQRNLGYGPTMINQALANVLERKGLAVKGLEADLAIELKRLNGE